MSIDVILEAPQVNRELFYKELMNPDNIQSNIFNPDSFNKDFIFDKWLPALRSDTYVQGHGVLRRYGMNIMPDKFCCLGVGCDVLDNSKWNLFDAHDPGTWFYGDDGNMLSETLANTAGFNEPNGTFMLAQVPSHKAIGVDPYNLRVILPYLNDGSRSFIIPFTFHEIANVIELHAKEIMRIYNV